MGMHYGTVCNMCTIAIQPLRLQSQQKDCLGQTETFAVPPTMGPMIPGLESQKKGIGLGHRQIPDMHPNEVGSNIS